MTKKDAIRTLGTIDVSLVGTFMGVDIQEFTKQELIKILSIQNRKWLESRGFIFRQSDKEAEEHEPAL
jgi:hypothetical protein